MINEPSTETFNGVSLFQVVHVAAAPSIRSDLRSICCVESHIRSHEIYLCARNFGTCGRLSIGWFYCKCTIGNLTSVKRTTTYEIHFAANWCAICKFQVHIHTVLCGFHEIHLCRFNGYSFLAEVNCPEIYAAFAVCYTAYACELGNFNVIAKGLFHLHIGQTDRSNKRVPLVEREAAFQVYSYIFVILACGFLHIFCARSIFVKNKD